MSAVGKWRGLAALVRDAVEHGSRAVERVHKETAARTFTILEAIPVVSLPTKVVHVVHDATVSTVHGTIRIVNHAVGTAVDAALEAAEARAGEDAPPPGGPTGA